MNSYTPVKLEEVFGRKVSEVFPEVMENGTFEIWKECYSNGDQPMEYNKQFSFGNNDYWFKNTVKKQDNGIVVVSEEVNELMDAKIQLEKLHQQLKFQNTIMNDSQKSSKLASYRWVVGSDKWDFSINIASLFKLSTKEEIFNKGIHAILTENELKLLMQEIEDCIESGHSQIKPLYFSRENRHGNFNYFALTGNFIPTTQGHVLVGIIQDNTAVIEKRVTLEKRNLKLELMNEELDSFNHVASHDLQEPVRKIRMFISRLQEDGLEGLPERHREYLDKIDISAIRMQELIHQLLNYSRIGKKDFQLEKLSLNQILDEVQLELEEQILARRAIIEVGKLPDIKGVPILIRQLFVNLISNAIKYQNPNSIARVTVWKLDKNNIDINSKNYVSISIQDNGIGFDQKNSKMIFGLFKRLHSKSEFPGTGIGLAICKKIVEYHKGHITATSELNKGSTFTIAFPIGK